MKLEDAKIGTEPLPADPAKRREVVDILRWNLRYTTWIVSIRGAWLRLAGPWPYRPVKRTRKP